MRMQSAVTWHIIRAIAAITNGSIKCSAKKRVRVALSTANPPHTHWTTSVPTYGIADRRFVITVAPQNDHTVPFPHASRVWFHC